MKRKLFALQRPRIAFCLIGAAVAAMMLFAHSGSAAAQSAEDKVPSLRTPQRWFIDPPEQPPEESPAGPAPRTADGRPDLSGVWWPGGDIAVTNLGVGVSRPPSGPPREDPDSPALYASLYQPWVAPRAATLSEKDDPVLRCIPPVIGPHVSLVNSGYVGQIIQTPTFLVLLSETFHSFKIIPTDGRPHREDVVASYRGDSVGHWEGDTLVVDTINFNGRNWVFDHGNVSFYSDALHVVERYRRLDSNTLEIRTTVEDPKMLTGPWTVATHTLEIAPFDQIMEVPCTNVQTAALAEAAAKENYGR